jgi:thioredoxin-related protein
MDAVTYPDKKVIDFIVKNLIALRIPSDAKPYSADFKITWTPTLLVLDHEGKEHHRTVGFLSPEELIPALLLGMAKTRFEQQQYAEALFVIQELLAAHPGSDSAPEALFLKGVSGYKSTHDPKPLKEAYEQLQAQYPASEWTKRAYPYRLL